MTNSTAETAADPEGELHRRYARAFEQYASLARAFVDRWSGDAGASAAADKGAELSKALSDWFQASVTGETADLSKQWNRWAGGFGMNTASAPSALDALTMKQERGWRRLAELAADCQRLQTQLAEHWAGVGKAAAEQFSAGFQNAAAPPADARGSQEMYAQWIDAAEKAYSQAAHGSDYARLLAELANALHAFKAEQGALIEQWALQMNLPTRTELDSLHLQVRELREQVRKLQSERNP